MRLGLVGVGLMDEEHLKAFSIVPEIEVVALADTDMRRARALARRYGVNRVERDVEALASAGDVDAIAIAVPPAAMTEVVPVICAHGRSVLCEKPLGVNAGEARVLLDAATGAGVVHALCHQRRYDPVHQRVRDLVAGGFVGVPPGGGRVSLVASWSLHHPSGVFWQIHGTEGTIEITPELRILGGRRGETTRDLGLPAVYLPAVGSELFSPYGERAAFGWGDNTPMLASLAAEFAGQVSGSLDMPPSYATFADGLWVQETLSAATSTSATD